MALQTDTWQERDVVSIFFTVDGKLDLEFALIMIYFKTGKDT